MKKITDQRGIASADADRNLEVLKRVLTQRNAGDGDRRMKKITDQYERLAYRHDPFTEVRIVCTDACEASPIVSLDEDGRPHIHRADGSRHNNVQTYDLVPLQPKVETWRDVWGVIDPDGDLCRWYDTEAKARDDFEYWSDIWHPRTGSIVRYVPAETQKMEADE